MRPCGFPVACATAKSQGSIFPCPMAHVNGRIIDTRSVSTFWNPKTPQFLEREQVMPTYLGGGLAVPHGRCDAIDKPMLAFARSDEGVPLEGTNERAELFFVLLTPSRMARLQPRLLADIAALFESEYVSERLRKAQAPEEVMEAIRAGLEMAVA